MSVECILVLGVVGIAGLVLVLAVEAVARWVSK